MRFHRNNKGTLHFFGEIHISLLFFYENEYENKSLLVCCKKRVTMYLHKEYKYLGCLCASFLQFLFLTESAYGKTVKAGASGAILFRFKY